MIDATGFVAARDQGERVEVGVAKATSTWRPRCAPTSTCSVSASIARRTTCFLPGPATAAARLSDAEIVTLCVASATDGDPKRPPVLASSPPAAAAPVPRAAQPGCAAQ